MSRFAQLAVAASRQAIEDSGPRVGAENAYDVGAHVATGGGDYGDTASETETLLTRGPNRVSPLLIPTMIANMASCQVSITFGLKGPAVTTVAAFKAFES